VSEWVVSLMAAKTRLDSTANAALCPVRLAALTPSGHRQVAGHYEAAT
jgi:hypothetical protein